MSRRSTIRVVDGGMPLFTAKDEERRKLRQLRDEIAVKAAQPREDAPGLSKAACESATCDRPASMLVWTEAGAYVRLCCKQHGDYIINHRGGTRLVAAVPRSKSLGEQK